MRRVKRGPTVSPRPLPRRRGDAALHVAGGRRLFPAPGDAHAAGGAAAGWPRAHQLPVRLLPRAGCHRRRPLRAVSAGVWRYNVLLNSKHSATGLDYRIFPLRNVVEGDLCEQYPRVCSICSQRCVQCPSSLVPSSCTRRCGGTSFSVRFTPGVCLRAAPTERSGASMISFDLV